MCKPFCDPDNEVIIGNEEISCGTLTCCANIAHTTRISTSGESKDSSGDTKESTEENIEGGMEINYGNLLDPDCGNPREKQVACLFCKLADSEPRLLLGPYEAEMSGKIHSEDAIYNELGQRMRISTYGRCVGTGKKKKKGTMEMGEFVLTTKLSPCFRCQKRNIGQIARLLHLNHPHTTFTIVYHGVFEGEPKDDLIKINGVDKVVQLSE